MKKHIYFVVFLVAFLAGTTAPAWGQASTQGKEFWVSSSIVCSPTKNAGIDPYLAVSAEKACTVTITGGVGNAINITQQVDAGSWTEFNNSNGLTAEKWYPINTKEPATVCNLAGQKNMYGLHITATENISVYIILRGEASMDASNILPLNALGYEYYVQDYTPEAHNQDSWSTNAGNMVTVTTILGTEDETKIDITPNGDTYDGHVSGTKYTIELNKGQTYYLISKKEKQLAGTHIVARDERKIAIYTGAPLTRLPNGVSARDALFEQPMPVEYWGTQFIVTRSLGKNGNLIGITASNDGTEIKLDGYSQGIYIDEGETYYIMLQNNGDPQAKKPGTSHVDKVITGDALYIETSCPCQVYSYDTGNGFKGDGTSELVSGQEGDPSSVWVSPIQQKINRITFATCYTDRTKAHFLNVITETSNCANTKLYALQYNDILKQIIELDQSNLLTWQPVPGNPKYSYARTQIGDQSATYKVFRLENDKGVIANIYGNGNDESYAYSAGSAAVEQGVNVNGVTFTNGFISQDKFCFGDELVFDANVGTDEISRVDWDFGDGISVRNGEVQTNHLYSVPGWYDVRAEIYGHQVCTEDADQYLGSVQFSFRVVRPDTTYVYADPECQAEDYTGDLKNDTIWPTDVTDCSNITVTVVPKGRITSSQDEVKAHDSYTDPQSGITYPRDPNNPQEYDQIVDVNLTELLGIKNAAGCDTIIHRHIVIITCLDMTISNDSANQHACEGESFSLPYTFRKGTIGDTYFILNGQKTAVTPENDYIALPVEDLKPGKYKASISVNDPNCEQTFDFPIDFAVYYPSTIFKYKFNNVLAVYNKAHNGGYDFVGYQWYRNGEEIIGANESVYHVDSTFTVDDEYYVVLTDKNGLSLPSCPQTITVVRPMESPSAPAQKVMRNQRMYILRQEQIYDIFGRRVE